MMTSGWEMAFLGVIAISITAAAISLIVTTIEMHQVLRRLRVALPAYDRAAREVARVFSQMHQLLARSRRTVNGVASVVDSVTDTATHALNGVARLKRRANTFLRGLRDGAGAEPRRHARRSRE